MLSGQSDPLFEPANILIMTPRPLIEILAYKERVEGLSQKVRVIKTWIDAGFLKTVEVGQYFMTKRTDEFSQLTEPVTCRETLCHEMKNQLTRNVGFEGTPKLDPCQKSQPVTCKVNMKWKLELNL